MLTNLERRQIQSALAIGGIKIDDHSYILLSSLCQLLDAFTEGLPVSEVKGSQVTVTWGEVEEGEQSDG